MTAIRIENLSKSFGWLKKVEAVKNLSLEVETGQVYGLLGRNGAGKTTTIRMILDLVRPDEGDVFIFDKHVHREHSILNKVGAQVEGANFYNFLSGRRNLKVLALTGNMDNPEPHIDELLELVGMTERSRRRVKGYSTGMKQRLGLAAALLNNPKLVILDEPTNGLDPQGIQEIRFLSANWPTNMEKRCCFPVICLAKWNKSVTGLPLSTKGCLFGKARYGNCSLIRHAYKLKRNLLIQRYRH